MDMSSNSLGNIQSYLDKVLIFLKPYSMLVNCHMVGYLTEELWKTYIPESIQTHINSEEDIDAAVKLFWEFYRDPSTVETTSFGGLVTFLQQSQEHRLQYSNGIALSVDQINTKLSSLGFELKNHNELQIKEFMSEKKNHEVEIVAHLVASMCENRGNVDRLSVIDAGDGKGYLSSRLALEYRLSVLGIDAKATNTAGAEKRTVQLERAWTGLTKRAVDLQNGIVPTKKGRRKRGQLEQEESSNLDIQYQRSTHFITPSTDFITLFKTHYPDTNPTGFCLSGLHTCGNLASSCLEIFQNNADIHSLCNVGCCYHLLDEQFTKNDFFVDRCPQSDNPTTGFPLSQYLKDQEYAMGRNGRMLASQSLDRTIDSSELPNVSLFYRALLETLIVKHNPDLQNSVQVGRMKKVTTFLEYVTKCETRTNMKMGYLDEDLCKLVEDHEFDRKLLDLFYLLRMTFAPVLESVILLDRLLYLKECGMEDVYLVQLFDPVVSPRCFAIVAVK